MPELVLRNLPLFAGFELFRRFKNRNPDAIETVREMFPASSACFICDEPVGADFDLWISDDPDNPRRLSVLSVICGDCMAQPAQVRLRKLRSVVRAVWPKVRHQIRSVSPVGVLRAANR